MKEIDQNIAKIKTDPRVEFFVKVNVPNQTTNKLTPSFEPTTNRREKLLSSCRQGVVNVFCNISNSKTLVSLLELFSCSVQNKLPWSPQNDHLIMVLRRGTVSLVFCIICVIVSMA